MQRTTDSHRTWLGDVLSDKLTDSQRAAIDAKLAEMKAGKFHPLTGPVIDQDGKIQLPPGEAIADSKMLSINWLVKGVETRIPN